MNAAPWIEAGAALATLGLAGLARAAAAAHEALPLAARPVSPAAAAAPGTASLAPPAGGPDPALAAFEAAVVTAELVWAALLAPALLLAAHAARDLAPGAGPAGALAAAAFGALVIGEALPSWLGARFAAALAARTGRLLGLLALPLRPFATHLLRRRAARPETEPAAADEEMLLKRLLDATGDAETEAGPEAEVMRQLLGRVLHLRETPVRSVMGPRSGIVWIGHREGPEAAARLMRESGHSRIPVCGRDLDDVIGTLHLKDVFLALHGVPAAATAGALAREPMFVDDDATLSLLLARWRRGGGTMAVVRDRSGIVVGLVTLSDVSEWLLAARRRRRRPPGPED